MSAMMDSKRRRYKRAVGTRRYKKMFVISTEGTNTEQQYFSMFNNDSATICIKCLKSKTAGAAPAYVLNRIRNFLKRERLRKNDEAWIVVDKDTWTDEQLTDLHNWSRSDTNYNLALSNPSFEYWLLLHFDEGNSIASPSDCLERLKRNLPNYNKNINAGSFTPEMILFAVNNAKRRDNPRCNDWPRSLGQTTVYRLVENILQVPKANA